MANYGQLRTEMDADPAGLGYASKTDAEVSALLNVANVTAPGATVNSAQIYEAVDDAEFEALNNGQKVRLRDVYSLSGDIPLDNSRVRTLLLTFFGAGTNTRANLAALQPPDITRASAIGLGAGRTRESDVFKTRAM